MRTKDTLFSKNSFNVQLEQLMDGKNFSDEAKSLILNILYKIDIAYKDYSKIKSDGKLKNDIISDMIDIIKNNCNEIEISNPKSNKKKFKVDHKKKVVTTFPSEIVLLQALYYVRTKNTEKIKNIPDKALSYVVNNGYAINGTEIIRDFNGWSWTNSIEDTASIYYNIIYQNLLMLVGTKSMENILKSDNIRTSLITVLQGIYGSKKTDEIMKKLDTCCILIYMYKDKEKQNEVFNYLNKIEKKLLLVEKKSEYITKITKKNNRNMQIIGKIDAILNNKELLQKKYLKPHVKEKYKILDNYKQQLIKIQKRKAEQIEKNSNLVNPFEYVKRKNRLEEEIKILKNIKEICSNKKIIFNNIVSLERSVILSFYKKMEVYDLKKELMNLVYEMRYYNNLPIEKEIKVKDVRELEVEMRNVQRKLVNKLTENKMIDTFSKDYSVNYMIIKYVFNTKIMNINKIYTKLEYKNKKLYVEYFDENVLEYKTNANFSDDDFNELSKKTGRKIKIFI